MFPEHSRCTKCFHARVVSEDLQQICTKVLHGSVSPLGGMGLSVLAYELTVGTNVTAMSSQQDSGFTQGFQLALGVLSRGWAQGKEGWEKGELG